MESENQEKIWDNLAESWHSFRQRPLKIAEANAKRWKPGRILEIGCGNCRNLLPFSRRGFKCYGVDFSKEMLEYARKYMEKHDFQVEIKKANATSLPFPSKSFDYVLCLATFHHLESDERKKALEEIKRVLKPRGKAIITVWNKLQKRFLFRKKDLMIPWRRREKIYKRYYHLFTAWELSKLLKNHRFKILKHNVFGRKLKFAVQV